MSFPWMLFITFLLSCGSAITTESSRGLHVAKNFSNGKNLSREVIYLSENEDAASNSNDDLDGVRKSSIELPIFELTDDKPFIEYQNLVDNQIYAADLTPSEPFDGGNHSIEPNRKRIKSCPPGCRRFNSGTDDDPTRCRCTRIAGVTGNSEIVVRNLFVKSLFPENVTIAWSPLRGYRRPINYTSTIAVTKRLGCEQYERNFSTEIYVRKNDPSTSRTIHQIYPYTRYRFTVIVNTADGQGTPVSTDFETPPLEIPTSKVSNLRLADGFNLAWDPPEDCSTITGPVKVTRLEFSCLSEWGKNWNASHETMGYEFDLKRLHLSPSTRYKVCAYVIRDFHKPVNESNCQELQWTTESVRPRAVDGFHIHVERTITVRWEEVGTSMYGEIESYHVSLIIGNSVIQKRTVKVSELEKCTENYVCLRNWTLPSNVSTNDVIKLQIFAKNTLSDENGIEITKWFTLDDLYDKEDVGLDILPGKQNTTSIPRSTSKAVHNNSSTVQCYNVMLLLVHVIFTRIKLF